MSLVWLKKKRDFEAFRPARHAFSKGLKQGVAGGKSKSYQSPGIRIRVISPTHQNVPRFGFIVPKKVLAKAVDRNKLKRRFKTLLQRNANMIKPADVLIFPTAGLLKVKYSKLEVELEQVFSKANLWK